MDCIEVRYDKGIIEQLPGAELEDWSDVQMYVDSVEDYGGVTGWGRWARLYKAVDEHGDCRYYFVEAAEC
jgi:hypothetical protein